MVPRIAYLPGALPLRTADGVGGWTEEGVGAQSQSSDGWVRLKQNLHCREGHIPKNRVDFGPYRAGRCCCHLAEALVVS